MPVIAGGILYFNGWAPGGDPGEQADLPSFQVAIEKGDKNHDGKLAQDELPKEWQPTGTWGAIDLDRDGLLNERDWNFFRARRAAQNSVIAVRLGGKGDVTETNIRLALFQSAAGRALSAGLQRRALSGEDGRHRHYLKSRRPAKCSK